jgi:hypothetical protein
MSLDEETAIQSIPVVLPAPEETPKPKPERDEPIALDVKLPPRPVLSDIENPLVTLIAWTARIVTGFFLISNIFPISFITSIAVFGWLQRRMQAIALYGWWRASPRRERESFNDFLAELGEDAPILRPRWFWRERIVDRMGKISKDHGPGGFFKMGWTVLTLPIHSLWVNFREGAKGLFATFMVTGWGCMFMLFAWHYGWLNSFHKGYEEALLGLGLGILGSFIFAGAVVYVPMAQAHQTAAGEVAAFFQFRVVLRLILTRPTIYMALIAGIALASFVFDIPRLVTLNDNFIPNHEGLEPGQALAFLEGYWFLCSIFFFIALLLLRSFAAWNYRTAMLEAVQEGTILTSELPGRLATWFDNLEIFPQAQLPQPLLLTMFKTAFSLKYRAFLFTLLFVVLFLFTMRFWFSYFLVYSEYRGILNHPVIQVPCMDWTPWHLIFGRHE